MRHRRLSLDRELIQHGAGQVLDAIASARTGFAAHEADLALAAQGWVGASGEALRELRTRWEESHSEHQTRVGRVGDILQTATGRFVVIEGGGISDA